MKDSVERLLYITLVLIFIGLGLALYVVALVIHGQAEQLKKIEAINQAQSRTISEIRATQSSIELSDQRNAKIIICMLQVPVAQRTPDLERNCRSQVTPTVTAPTPVSPVHVTSPKTTSPPMSSPAPSPTPTPSVTDQVLTFLKGLL